MKQSENLNPQAASTAEIRRHFPALERVYNDFPVAYFDGPGGTQVPRVVAEAMTDYLFNHNANTHWNYPSSAETDEKLAYARAAFADFFNSGANEIVFGANMTTITFHLARTIGRTLSAGDEIIVTELDHHANIAPWLDLQTERGVSVKTARMNAETGLLDWEHLESLLTSRTKLLAIGAASNALGTINDLPRAVKLARKAGALIFIDAVHYLSHEQIDVRELDCDFVCCSAYKFYGPHIGIMYAKHDLLRELKFPKLSPAPDTAPEKAETGTQNHEAIVGAAAAVDFLASLANTGESRRQRLTNVFDAFHERGQQLVKQLWDGLSSIEGVRLFGPPADGRRTPTISFTVRDLPAKGVAGKLAQKGVFVSHGNFYAQTVVERLGAAEQGLVRAGCACYNTAEEIERLIDAVKTLS